MARGLLRGGEAPRLFACAKRWEKLQASAGALGATPCRDAGEVLENAQVLIAAVKPYLIEEVLAPIRDRLEGKLLLSVGGGLGFCPV